MDAVWHGIAAGFEWLFAVVSPLGRFVNIFFIAVGFIGTAYWLWYTTHVQKGGHNYLADKTDQK
jgi:hypothetical protein